MGVYGWFVRDAVNSARSVNSAVGELPAGDDLGAVDRDGASAHGDVEVGVRLAAQHRVGAGRPQEVAGEGAGVHAHQVVLAVHRRGEPVSRAHQAPAHVGEADWFATAMYGKDDLMGM